MDGVRLRELRTRYGLTQQQVSRAAGMRQPDLSAIENGRRGSAEARRRVLSAIRSLVRPSTVLDVATRRQLLEIFDRYGASDVRIFGSVARSSDEPGSDLDLIARFPDGFDLFDLMNLEEELEDALGIAVDVVADSPRTDYALSGAKRQAVAL